MPHPPTNSLRRRRDMTERHSESWPPPLFSPPTTPFARFAAAMRRFLDLQAGSIWRDLRAELAHPHGVVLDVGCGAQPYRPLVHSADKYTGIDSASAKQNFGYEIPNTLYYAGDTWPIETASVDLVLCTETLEHVPDPPIFLSEAARVTKSGGRLLLTVPFAARWHFIPHDYWRFTPTSLRELLERHGFTNIAVYARGNALTVACYKTMALILPVLMPHSRNPLAKILLPFIGLLFSPLLVLLAIIANLSLSGKGGDDCLGYTAIATRKP